MAPKKSPKKGASPPKQSPKKGASPPKKTRQSPSKAKVAAIEAEIAAEQPSQRVTRRSPAKSSQSPAKGDQSPAKKGQSPAKISRKTASPSKVTKSRSPAKSAAKASPTNARDKRFRGAPEESSRGYKAEDSTEDIIRAIDGRTLTKLDKLLVTWIHDLERAENDGRDSSHHDDTARQVVRVLELPYADGVEPREKAHFNLYWRFRTLIEEVTGEWPSTSSDVDTGESDDDGSETGVIDDDDDDEVAVDYRRARVRGLTGTSSAIKQATEAALKKKQTVYLDNIKAKARQSFMARGRYNFVDEPKYGHAAKQLMISPEAFKDAIDKGLGSAIRALPAENTLRTLGTNSGQPMFPQRITEEGIAKGYAGRGLETPQKTPKTTRPITQGTPSPQKSADPRQAEKDKAQREAKRIADVKARQGLIAEKEVYPPTKENTPLPFASRRGNLVSSTNPGTISIVVGKKADGTEVRKERVNPFFETLPGPEVWHRNMPPFFSFGETKLMEQIISDQINADLARKHDDVAATATESRAKKTVHAADIKLRKDQWELPQLTEAEERDILAKVRKAFPRYTGQAHGSPSKKRAHETSHASPRKQRG